MKNIIFKIVPAFLLITLISVDCFAGMGGGGGGMGGGPGTGMGMGVPCGGPFPPCPVPLDSSVILLLSAGALYGAYKIYHSLKKNPA